MKGLLEKRSGNFRIYQLRWFQRVGHHLNYYASKDSKQPNGSINLHELTRIDLIPDSTEFILVVRHRLYYLRASNDSTRKTWLESLYVWVPANSHNHPLQIPSRLFSGLSQCIQHCLEHGIVVQGLFRTEGKEKAVTDIENRVFYKGESCLDDLPQEYSVHDVASALTRLLRELPETLFTYSLEPLFRKARDPETISDLVLRLPQRNRLLLKELMHLCTLLCRHSSTTMMNAGALAVCLAPCIGLENESGLFQLNPFFKLTIEHFFDIFEMVRDSETVYVSSRENLDTLDSLYQIQDVEAPSLFLNEGLCSDRTRYSWISLPHKDSFSSSCSESCEEGEEIGQLDQEKMISAACSESLLGQELKHRKQVLEEVFFSQRMNSQEYRCLVDVLLQAASSFVDSVTRTAQKHSAEEMLEHEKLKCALLAGRIIDLEKQK